MGLTNYLVIMASVFTSPILKFWGKSWNWNSLRHANRIRVCRRLWASAVRQTRIPAPLADFLWVASPLDRREYLADLGQAMLVEVMTKSLSANKTTVPSWSSGNEFKLLTPVYFSAVDKRQKGSDERIRLDWHPEGFPWRTSAAWKTSA